MYSFRKLSIKLKEIGRKVKKLRIAAGYTSYEQFAVKNNIGRKQYWRIEDGSNITLITLIKILTLLDISLEEFFKDL